ncbi:MAG: energy transducer TonB [Arenimonas sp.]
MRFIKKLKYLAAVALLSFVALPGMAESPSKKPMAFYVNYELTLASDGSIEKLALRDKKLSPLITDFLEKSIRSWKFTPGSIDGVPHRTESALWLNVEAMPREDGGFDLLIADAYTGAFGADMLTPPIYPMQEMWAGNEAVVRVLVSYDENGVVTKVERVSKLGAREEKALRPFVQASFAAAKTWRFNPEKIGGRGIAGSGIVPVKFCMMETKCRSFLTGAKEKEKLALQLDSRVLVGSSRVSILRTEQLN